MPRRTSVLRALAVVLVVGICAIAAWVVWNEVRRHAFASGPPPIVRGPQVGSVTRTSATIAWRTDPAVRASLEVVGPSEGESWVHAAQGATTDPRFTVTDLRPGSGYRYTLRCDGKPTGPTHAFATAPEAPAAFRFAAIGDTGSGSDAQKRIAARILAEAPSFVIHTGDVAYPHGHPDDFDEDYFFPYRNLIDHVPFYLSLGNHDVETERGRPLLEAVPLPKNDRTNTSQFYSWDWSNGHFIALDTELTFSEGSPQYEWLAADLSKTTAAWRVVFFHHPPYSSSRSGGEQGVRAKLCPLFEKYRVDLVFSGHDHQYERTFPIVQAKPVGAAQEPDYANPPGPMYVVTGGGGKSLYESGRKEFTAVSRSAYHHTRVDVDGATLTLTAIDMDGTTFDRMTIRKP